VERKGLTKIALCKQLGVSRPYLYSVLAGEVAPPVPERQFRIAQILELDSAEATELFEVAARERNELPADIANYYLADARHRRDFRRTHAREMQATWKDVGSR
jgi:transcriptional regulator with XRE-family HTH domain